MDPTPNQNPISVGTTSAPQIPQPPSSVYPEPTKGTVGTAPPPLPSSPSRLIEALCIFALAAIAGALFHVWYGQAVKILPHSVSVCSSSTHDAISLACHATLFGNFFAYLTLFSVVSYIAYLLCKKSYVLAFYFGGLFVAVFFFLGAAIAFDYAAIYKLHWLFVHSSLWSLWLTPALIAGLGTLFFYALLKYTGRLVKIVLGAAYVLVLITSLLFMPKLVGSFVAHQSKAGAQKIENQLVSDIKNMGVALYAPKNYTGLLKLKSADAVVAKSGLIPQYELFYDFPDPYPNQSGNTIVHIYRGASNDFKPPANCGDGAPTSTKYKSTQTYPCKVVLKTKQGRDVYGYRSAAKLEYYKIDPNSDAIKKVQPDTFYVPLGDVVISFPDPANNEDNESPLTPEVIEQFVDSLEPVTGNDLDQFINKYILLKAQ